MNRAAMLVRLADESFDVLVIGGGATGLGCAVDAASRGYRTALVDAGDFASGTSSRSTKLIHGGVRYLAQGNLHLVREALRERATLQRNAPALVHDRAFLVPAYRWYQVPYFLTGLKLYDALAGSAGGFAACSRVSRAEALSRLPWLCADGLRGAMEYHDGQFDDARMAVALARTAADRGAAVANYVRVVALRASSDGKIAGAGAVDTVTGAAFDVRARVTINAAGTFVDAVRRMDDPAAVPLLALSRGTHIVVASETLPGDDALLVPKTEDGRVIFAIPWRGRVVVGTTDVATDAPVSNPKPTGEEIGYLLKSLNRYAASSLDETAIAATFAGLRPLVARGTARTSRLSREHLVERSRNGLVTVAGGKWTTYRKMAQDAVGAAASVAGLQAAPSVTAQLRLHDDASDELQAIAAERPDLREQLHPQFDYTKADVVNAFANEMACTADDVLARRTRLAFLDARIAEACRALVEELRSVSVPMRDARR